MKIGILGGGQLAKMLAIPAKKLGIELSCVDPAQDACAGDVTNVVQADFQDMTAIEQAFAGVDCVTYETENLPIQAVEAVASHYRLQPAIDALRVTQDRLLEKDCLTHLGIPTVDYARVDSLENLQTILNKWQCPAVLKTRRSGYDGKGQRVIKHPAMAKDAWDALSAHELIVEKFINYTCEVSLIAVRGQAGEMAFYPLILNQHEDGILRLSRAPYINDVLRQQAEAYAVSLMTQFDYVGVMTMEFFCVNNALVVNEIAPRVHNSGHWTIEGAVTSQFENHLRAIAGLPLGATDAKGCVAMLNIIGEERQGQALSAMAGVYYHTYGKSPRPGRKLGHMTICADNERNLSTLLERVLSRIHA